MWSTTVLLALVGSTVAIVDEACTANGVYTQTAAICSNKFADTTCDQVYASSTVAAGGADERPAACFNGTNGIDEDVKAMAIQNCAKTCGYCCETDAYNCENKRQPRIQCNTITRAMCESVEWRQTIAEDCPSACGFCMEGGCIDVAPDCKVNPTICMTIGMEEFVAVNCQRTCEKCPTAPATASPGTPPSPGTGCADTNKNCASWVKNGFCSNSFYSEADRMSTCGQSCGLCTGAGAGSPSGGACPNAVDTNSNCASWATNGFCSNSFYTDEQKKSMCGKTCGLC